MAQGLITDTYLSNLADAIRDKLETQDTYKPFQMAGAISLIGWELPETHTWSGASDSDIVDILKAAHTGIIDLQEDCGWAVGDVRTISVSGNAMDIAISEFGDYNDSGCVMQFDFLTSFGEYTLNNSNSNYGSTSYKNCVCRNQTLPAKYNLLPSWLKDNMIDIRCYAGAGNNGAVELLTGKKLELRAWIEISGSRGSTASGEGSRISLYNSVNPVAWAHTRSATSGSTSFAKPKYTSTNVYELYSGVGKTTSPVVPFGLL